jgi:CRISPR/Cas system-associated exonuclease Cas4 (RecB family)
MKTDKPHQIEFNQTSLQDFMACPRRFELSILKDAHWPTASSSPLSKYEELTEIGTQFHHLCQQFFTGIDPNLITSSIANQDILRLWQAFLPFGTELLPYSRYYEQILRIPFEGDYLVAKFDLMIDKRDEGYLIFDWKTANKKPSRTTLANRVQTSLYPYLFQQAAGNLFSVDSIHPSEIEMVYWFPLSDDPEEVFPYSEDQHQEVSQHLSDLRSQIHALIATDKPFPLTDDHSHCKYCRFRSYCERGFQTSPLPAGAEIEKEDLSNMHFDLDQIKEIEY